MPRPGELTFFNAIGQEGVHFAMNKPFSESTCGVTLMQVGAVLSVLPPPPARILECGCGTGWLTQFLCQRGYDAVGADVSAHAVELARSNDMFTRGVVPEFHTMDSEQLTFDEEFDAVVFFDSLHHSVNEKYAVEGAFRALKPGGLCVVSEPGRGHEARSAEAIAQYDVTEKDMPPSLIRKLGKAAGFGKCKTYPRGDHIGRLLYTNKWSALGRLSRLLSFSPFRYLALFGLVFFLKRDFGMVVMEKPSRPAQMVA